MNVLLGIMFYPDTGALCHIVECEIARLEDNFTLYLFDVLVFNVQLGLMIPFISLFVYF